MADQRPTPLERQKQRLQRAIKTLPAGRAAERVTQEAVRKRIIGAAQQDIARKKKKQALASRAAIRNLIAEAR